MIDEEDKISNEDFDIEQIVQCIFDFEDDETQQDEQIVCWDIYDQIALERMSYESY
jgi:hypothetical protein